MKSKKRKNYTKAFKEEAVKLITDEGYSFAEAGRNLGVNPNLISRWKREQDGDGSEMPPEQLVAMRDIFDYIEMFYNCRRRHSFIENKSPQQWELEKAA